jgi:hypothetical protein
MLSSFSLILPHLSSRWTLTRLEQGWEWNDHHDLALMGYSIRVDNWRYTAWLPWDSASTSGVWAYPPLGEELYAHEQGDHEPPGLFDELEARSLLATAPGAEQHRNVTRYLFEKLRASVLRRRGIVQDEHLLCDRIEQRVKREACKTEYARRIGVNWKVGSALDHESPVLT